MRKDDLLDMLRAENTKESKELMMKLTFLKEMFFKNELNEAEQDEYRNIHSKDVLKTFMFSRNLQEKYDNYCKKEQLSNPFNNRPVFNFDFGGKDSSFEDAFKSIFGSKRVNTFLNTPRRGSDIVKSIVVTPEEASKGATRYIRIDERRIEARIPAGVSEGVKILIKEMGEESPNGGKPGDLYIRVHIKTDESSQEDTKKGSSFDDIQEEKIVVDPKKKYLCKYHHNTGCTSDKPGDGFSEKRCPGCGQFYMPLQDSFDWSSYASSDDPSYSDDENDLERIQNSYDPPEAIYDDDGNLEY
ncbi:hypothetical protein IKT18_01935 [Candidatus Saccharibacteria bacterium]|nr:hypothetical protein [Candidatus Saccharibacteria bacterium]